MKMHCGKSPEALRHEIWALDLDPLKVKLMDPVEGEGWSRQQADLVEEQYRQFLFLTVVRSETVVPTKEIDAFWHAHILDTMKYFADCDRAFGFYLHHFPYFGIRSAQDAANLESAFVETRRIWKEIFGRELNADREKTGANTCGVCGGSCTACSAITPKSASLLHAEWRPSLR